LAIARSLVEALGGKISVESQLGVGTTFTIVLPVQRV
jgi:signal transduction histidine kinase